MKKILTWVIGALIVSGIVWAAQTDVESPTDSFQVAWERQHAMDTELYGYETSEQTWRSSVTQTEMGYVHGITSGIQTQLNAKADVLGADDNYVTDAEKTVIGNTSGANTGDDPADDTEYNAASWQDNTDAATKNAIRDKIETMGGGSGDVVGPSSSTDNAIPRYDSTTGKLIQGSGVTIDDNDIVKADGFSVDATADGGQYTYFLEDTDNGSNYSGRAVYGDLTHSTLYADPLAVGTKNQFMIYTAPASRTMSDDGTKNVASGSFITYSKEAAWTIVDSDTSTPAAANGVQAFTVPSSLNGMNLVDVVVSVHTKGITGTLDVQVRRRRAGSDVDMLSTKVTLGDEFFANDEEVNTSNDDVITGDQIYIDVDAIHSGTAAKGLSVTTLFQLP